MKYPLVISALALVQVVLSAEQPVHIYIANDDHTDFMWRADDEAYSEAFVELLDFHLGLIEETRNNPSEFQNRFNTDGWYWLDRYRALKSPKEFQHLMDEVKAGRISVPLNALVSTYGGQPTEAVLRGMYPAGRLEREFDFRIPLVQAVENQTLPLGLASLWAGSGAKYSWKGVCACVPNTIDREELRHRDHEIYWYTGQDGQKLLMKWHSIYHSEEFGIGGNRFIGGYAEAYDPVGAVEFLTADSLFLERYRAPGMDKPYSVRSAFGYGWDALARKTGERYPLNPATYLPATDHFHEVAMDLTNEERQVIVSNQMDFFADFEEHYSEVLPSKQVTHGNEWDLYCASVMELTSTMRRAVERLRGAEALAAWVSLFDSDFMDGFGMARHKAYTGIGLFWEHNLTADSNWVPREARALWLEGIAGDVDDYVTDLGESAAEGMSELIPAEGGLNRFYVFNPLGWKRTDAVDYPYSGPESIHVHDMAAGQEVPHQIVQLEGERVLRILAKDLPAVGYKVYEIRAGRGQDFDDAAKVDQSVRPLIFENSRVRIGVERDGAITSLVDLRDEDRELAATIDDTHLNDLSPNSKQGSWTVVESAGPVSVTLRCESWAGRNHVTRITLYRDSPRVDIVNEITENFTDMRHWSFSFNIDNPRVRTEETGAIIEVALQSDGGDYAERSARYDYATLNHFADISEGGSGVGVTLSNRDCAFVKLGKSRPDFLDTETPQLHVLAGGQVDGDRLGIRNQNGAEYFLQRFALRPHQGYDPVQAMIFAMEHQNPPIAAAVKGGPDAPLAAESDSLLTVDRPGVLLWALKPAEEGIADGVIARFWNVGEEAVEARVDFSPGLARAIRTTHLETDLAAVALDGDWLKAAFAPRQMATYRLLPEGDAR